MYVMFPAKGPDPVRCSPPTLSERPQIRVSDQLLQNGERLRELNIGRWDALTQRFRKILEAVSRKTKKEPGEFPFRDSHYQVELTVIPNTPENRARLSPHPKAPEHSFKKNPRAYLWRQVKVAYQVPGTGCFSEIIGMLVARNDCVIAIQDCQDNEIVVIDTKRDYAQICIYEPDVVPDEMTLEE